MANRAVATSPNELMNLKTYPRWRS